MTFKESITKFYLKLLSKRYGVAELYDLFEDSDNYEKNHIYIESVSDLNKCGWIDHHIDFTARVNLFTNNTYIKKLRRIYINADSTLGGKLITKEMANITYNETVNNIWGLWQKDYDLMINKNNNGILYPNMLNHVKRIHRERKEIDNIMKNLNSVIKKKFRLVRYAEVSFFVFGVGIVSLCYNYYDNVLNYLHFQFLTLIVLLFTTFLFLILHIRIVKRCTLNSLLSLHKHVQKHTESCSNDFYECRFDILFLISEHDSIFVVPFDPKTTKKNLKEFKKHLNLSKIDFFIRYSETPKELLDSLMMKSNIKLDDNSIEKMSECFFFEDTENEMLRVYNCAPFFHGRTVRRMLNSVNNHSVFI